MAFETNENCKTELEIIQLEFKNRRLWKQMRNWHSKPDCITHNASLVGI